VHGPDLRHANCPCAGGDDAGSGAWPGFRGIVADTDAPQDWDADFQADDCETDGHRHPADDRPYFRGAHYRGTDHTGAADDAGANYAAANDTSTFGVVVDRLVDLDLVVAELQARRSGWESRGLDVGDFTWRDGQAAWPQPIVTDRALVAEPESLGMTMEAAPDRLAELVLWCGGWADLDCLIDGEYQLLSGAPKFQHVEECATLAEDLAELLLVGT
jgi:hypothetical protein